MSFAETREKIRVGDTVILYVGVTQIYALEVKEKILNKKNQEIDNVFQTQYGGLKVMDLIGMKFGSKVNLSKGWAYVLYPTTELWTVTLPHRTQILYTPDIAMVIMELELGPGSVVCEAGTGSGSLSHAILQAIGDSGHLYTSDFHQHRVDVVKEEFQRHGLGDRVTVSCCDICSDGWGLEDIADAAFLDLPNPWEALPHAIKAIKTTGGRICSFSPCVEQVSRTNELMNAIGLTDVMNLECIQREFQVRTITCTSVPVLPDASKQSRKNEVSNNENSKCDTRTKIIDGENRKKVKKEEIEIQSIDNNSTTSSDVGIPSDSKNIKDSKNETSEIICNAHKFKTAVPLLKMQGHTGFLTFATVPPHLPRNFGSHKIIEPKIESITNDT